MRDYPSISGLLLAAGLLLAPGFAARAQTAPEAYPAAAELKDGAFRRNGQTFQLLGGQQTPLTQPLPLGNGFELRPDGRLVSNGVTRRLLQNGQAVTMEGNVVLLRDDMLTPAAIARVDKAVTGGSSSTFSVASGTNLAALAPQLARTASRLAQLQQLTGLLEQRATALANGKPSAPGLEKKIQELSSQLKP